MYIYIYITLYIYIYIGILYDAIVYYATNTPRSYCLASWHSGGRSSLSAAPENGIPHLRNGAVAKAAKRKAGYGK